VKGRPLLVFAEKKKDLSGCVRGKRGNEYFSGDVKKRRRGGPAWGGQRRDEFSSTGREKDSPTPSSESLKARFLGYGADRKKGKGQKIRGGASTAKE